MKHTLFLFDLDDTLLDFRASEHLSFERTLRALGYLHNQPMISRRVVHETAQVLDEIAQRFP